MDTVTQNGLPKTRDFRSNTAVYYAGSLCFRMLVSQGFSLGELGISSENDKRIETDPKRYGKNLAKITIYLEALLHPYGLIIVLKKFLVWWNHFRQKIVIFTMSI